MLSLFEAGTPEIIEAVITNGSPDVILIKVGAKIEKGMLFPPV